MSNKQIILLLIILVLLCDFTFKTGYSVGIKQQQEINDNLKKEYEGLKSNYDVLENQYKRDLESCYVQLERYERGGNSE